MALRLAINGFGRIGRNILRAVIEQKSKDIEVVALNDMSGDAASAAHLLRYDSVHGRLNSAVRVDGATIDVGFGAMQVLARRNIADLPWKDLGVDIVLECTGVFGNRAAAAEHIAVGAKKVLISAPANDADLTVVYGVNDDNLTAAHDVVSNASCTTNCLAPVAAVLHKEFGIEQGFMTTIHSYTSDQRILDNAHKTLIAHARRRRALSPPPPVPLKPWLGSARIGRDAGWGGVACANPECIGGRFSNLPPKNPQALMP